MALCEFKIELTPNVAESLDEILYELGEDGWSQFEDVLAGRLWVVGAFENRKVAQEAWERLRVRLPEMPAADPEIRELADEDWRNAYKAHFHAWTYGGLHWVPIWEKESYEVPPGEEVVWLDPGMAFGTGNHETTRLCVESLLAVKEEAEKSGRPVSDMSVLDAGCGSGILSISAVRLGFGGVQGFDIDGDSIRISRENAELNGLGGKITFAEDGLPDGIGEHCWDVVLANILANVLVEYRDCLVAAVAGGRRLILSGILASELDSVKTAFLETGNVDFVESRVLGEWCVLVFCGRSET